MEKVVICGGGKHCSVVLDVLLACGEYEIVGILDDGKDPILGIPVIGNDSLLPELYAQGVRKLFVAIGSNRIRQKVAEYAEGLGYTLINAISPKANVSSWAKLGRGILINHGAAVNALACIEDGCIINTNASVDHHCRIHAYSHVCPGVHIAGSCDVGMRCFIGTGSNVIDGVTIGADTTVGAGAAVVRPLPENCTAVGVPARIIRNK